MICDHIIVGIRDSSLLEMLQMDPDLTLDKEKVSKPERGKTQTPEISRYRPLKRSKRFLHGFCIDFLSV